MNVGIVLYLFDKNTLVYVGTTIRSTIVNNELVLVVKVFFNAYFFQ